ncbi:hypothetical protein CHS0354_023751 [Potamilus streckersoni]|uniref:DNA-directed RNA polymerase n=1 Tax=Potamilus streckersoni TaxID=2493646 RepID=A0AAE0RZ28_9BIVA|nr:hypothetical protein CHS0354_023751 [Potamilus streckersoni]
MARYRGSTSKISRRLGVAITEKDQKFLDRRSYPPGQHGQSKKGKLSEYGTQLKEKQKMKFIYGILERQFRNYYRKASSERGVTGENLVRCGFANSRRFARQLVSHGHLCINGKSVNIPSFQLKPGDLIEFKKRSLELISVENSLISKLDSQVPVWLQLDKPNRKVQMKMPKVVEHVDSLATPFYGKFIAQPLERGYGVTLGNMLRRVLLASLPGTAISGIRIEGVFHEFSIIEGVKEDLPEIIQNLKKIRFKSLTKKDTVVSLSLKGPYNFTGADIQSSEGDFETANPYLNIATLSKNANLKLDLYISRGRGYIPGDEQVLDEKPLGYIGVDAIYSPIRNVRYTVENTRVEQRTDYEKLVLEVETDGTVTPSDAVSMATRIIVEHVSLFTQFSTESMNDYEEL